MITLREAKALMSRARKDAWAKHKEKATEAADASIRSAITSGQNTASVFINHLAAPEFITTLFAAGYRAGEVGEVEDDGLIEVKIAGW